MFLFAVDRFERVCLIGMDGADVRRNRFAIEERAEIAFGTAHAFHLEMRFVEMRPAVFGPFAAHSAPFIQR